MHASLLRLLNNTRCLVITEERVLFKQHGIHYVLSYHTGTKPLPPSFPPIKHNFLKSCQRYFTWQSTELKSRCTHRQPDTEFQNNYSNFQPAWFRVHTVGGQIKEHIALFHIPQQQTDQGEVPLGSISAPCLSLSSILIKPDRHVNFPHQTFLIYTFILVHINYINMITNLPIGL